MTKDLTVATPGFTYELDMIPPAGIVLLNGAAETQIMAGRFDATGRPLRRHRRGR
jgi:hypothetical protein